jgi:hypothetical protein
MSATARCRGLRAGTYTQKTVEINAAGIEGTMEVIDRILNCIVLGDEIDKSMARIRMIDTLSGDGI